jgi:hypothetical protein
MFIKKALIQEVNSSPRHRAAAHKYLQPVSQGIPNRKHTPDYAVYKFIPIGKESI